MYAKRQQPLNSRRMRHLAVRLSYLQDKVNEGFTMLVHIGTNGNLADIGTKPLPAKIFHHLCSYTSGAEQICRCRTNPIHSTRSRIQCCNLVPRSQHCGGARRSESVLTRLRSHRLHKPEGQRERPLLRAQGEIVKRGDQARLYK